MNLIFGPFSSVLTTPASTVAARYGMALVEGAGGAPSVFDTPSNQADHDVFDVSLPVADELVPFVRWVASLPPGQRPKTAAYPMAQDPFADPPVQLAQTELAALGVRTVYSQVFPEQESAYKSPADQVASLKPDLVVLGSTDVPTVAAFMQEFEQQRYTPKLFIAAARPDQGTAFTSAVGTGNADGMMVPDGWYPGFSNAASQSMVREYVAQYGGNVVRRQRGRGRGVLGRPGDEPGGHGHGRHRQREDHCLPAQRGHADQRAGAGEVRRAGGERRCGRLRLPVAGQRLQPGSAVRHQWQQIDRRLQASVERGVSDVARRQHARKSALVRLPKAQLLTMQDWPVSYRLLAVIVLALIMGLVFGGLRVAAAVDSAAGFGRVTQLATFGQQTTGLVQALEDERDETAGVIPAATSQAAAKAVRRWYAATDTAAARVKALGAGIGGAFPANIQARVATVLSAISHLDELRSTAQSSQSALAVIADYSGPIGDLLSLNTQIAQGTADSRLATDVQTLNSLAMGKEEATQQRAILFNALSQQLFADDELQALTTAESEQAADLAEFSTTASPAEQTTYRDTVAGPSVNRAELIEEYVISVGSLNTSALNLSPQAAPQQWYSAMSGTISKTQAVELSVARSSWRAAGRCSGVRSGTRSSSPS